MKAFFVHVIPPSYHGSRHKVGPVTAAILQQEIVCINLWRTPRGKTFSLIWRETSQHPGRAMLRRPCSPQVPPATGGGRGGGARGGFRPTALNGVGLSAYLYLTSKIRQINSAPAGLAAGPTANLRADNRMTNKPEPPSPPRPALSLRF